MRYLAAVVIWMLLSMLWGIAGTLIGPGIVMLIIASVVGAVGSILTVAQFICGYKAHTLGTGLVVTITGIALTWFIAYESELAYQAILILAVFIALPSFVISYLLDRVL